MAKKLYEESSVQAIANAIRVKNGSTDTYKISEMPAAISAIQTGGSSGGETIWESLKIFQLDSTTKLTEVVANIPYVTALDKAFVLGRNHAMQRIELTVSERLTSASNFFGNGGPKNLSEVIFHGDFSKVRNLNMAFSCSGTGTNDSLKKITGLDFTSVTNATNAFASQRGLRDLEIKADTVNVSLPLGDSSSLTVASCVNVLNALKDRTDQDALTLKLSTVLTNDSTGTLYVNYVKLDADTGLYVSCEQTDDSAMTIAAAITAKNWTIA